MITPEDKQKVSDALEAANGHFQAAAKTLGVTRRTLYNYVYQDPELKAKWVTERHPPPTDSVQLHRPVIPTEGNSPLFTKSEESEALAIKKEDAFVRDRRWDDMGISPDIKKMAVALQQFQRRHYASVIEMMGGGVAKQYLEILAEIEEVNRELEAGDLEINRELMLREHRIKLGELSNKLYDRAVNATLVQAKIAALKNTGKGDKPSSKPKGFLAIQAQPGSNVHIHATGDGDESQPE